MKFLGGLETTVDATALTAFLFPWWCCDNAGPGIQGNRVTRARCENVLVN